MVSLFSSPTLHWIKTVIKVFSTGCRRVSSMDWKTSSGGGEVGKNWRSLEPGDNVLTTTYMIVGDIFRQLTTFVVVLAGKNVFLRFFLSFNSITSAVTACNVGVFKKTWTNTWISFLHHRNQFQTSIKFSLKFRSWVDVAIGYFK